ncbi:MAG: hypothetical protein MUF23_03425, partial [Pirellula sp.]|nr:hypothetical protein [Pirellula sp.]
DPFRLARIPQMDKWVSQLAESLLPPKRSCCLFDAKNPQVTGITPQIEHIPLCDRAAEILAASVT